MEKPGKISQEYLYKYFYKIFKNNKTRLKAMEYEFIFLDFLTEPPISASASSRVGVERCLCSWVSPDKAGQARRQGTNLGNSESVPSKQTRVMLGKSLPLSITVCPLCRQHLISTHRYCQDHQVGPIRLKQDLFSPRSSTAHPAPARGCRSLFGGLEK